MNDAGPDFMLAEICRQVDEENAQLAAESERRGKENALWWDARRFVHREHALSRAVRKDLRGMEPRWVRVLDPMADIAVLAAAVIGLLLITLGAAARSGDVATGGGIFLCAAIAVAVCVNVWRSRRWSPAYYRGIKYQHGVGSALAGWGPLTLLGGWSGLTSTGFSEVEAECIVKESGGLPAVREDEISPMLIRTRRALDSMRVGRDR